MRGPDLLCRKAPCRTASTKNKTSRRTILDGRFSCLLFPDDDVVMRLPLCQLMKVGQIMTEVGWPCRCQH